MTARLHTLSNGVRVVCDPMPGLETLALSVVAGRGAACEDADRNGWSHLLEHMVFKGAGKRSARQIVEDIEGQGGQINAATGYERTSFQVRALAGGLDLGMEIISDLILRPSLDPVELKREKQVIAQEIAEADDTPDDRVFDLAQAVAFAGQPVGRPILGSRARVNAAKVPALADWRAQLYAPDRLVVSAAGAVEEDELLALAQATFGAEPARVGAPPPPDPVFTAGAASESRKLEQAHLVLLAPAFGARDPDYFALRLFAEALGGGMSSRLFQSAREERGLAYAIDAYAETYEQGGLLGIYAGCEPDKAQELAALAGQEICALAEGVSDAELARAKAQLKAHLFMAREQPLARAEQAAGQALIFGHLFNPADLAAGIDAVTGADFRRLGERLTQPALTAGAVLGPKNAQGAVAAFGVAIGKA